MEREAFYKEITKRGVYTVFNELRTALFGKLATDSHIPISSSRLDEVIAECENLPPMLEIFARGYIGTGERFRHHYCETEDLRLHYFVNISREMSPMDKVANHLQTWDIETFGLEEIPEGIAGFFPSDGKKPVSCIVLFENHPEIQPNIYPKVIKHELSHASIERVIRNNKELSEYYFSYGLDPSSEESDFIEFICDLIPYVSTPSKKENGINKFISESEECFGYDAEEGIYADFIKTVIVAMAEGAEEDATIKEPSYEEFKSLADKYSFILRKTDGENRCNLLGVTKAMYYDKEQANAWYAIMSDILGESVDEDTREARKVLDDLYENMIG